MKEEQELRERKTLRGKEIRRKELREKLLGKVLREGKDMKERNSERK